MNKPKTPTVPPGQASELRLRLLDIHVIHVHHMEDQAVMVFAILSSSGNRKYPGSITIPLRVVQELMLESGDELTVLLQKTLSHNLIKKGKREDKI